MFILIKLYNVIIDHVKVKVPKIGPRTWRIFAESVKCFVVVICNTANVYNFMCMYIYVRILLQCGRTAWLSTGVKKYFNQ